MAVAAIKAASGTGIRGWLAPLLVGLLALAVYSVNLGHIPHFDELYHVLGARGVLEYGEPRIADGVYERTSLFTALIAVFFQWFGESVVVARLPSVLAGGVMAACMFAWTRASVGPVTAWFSTIAFLLSPFAVEIFQFARFYAGQALLFWLGAICAYAMAVAGSSSPGRSLLLGACAAVCFAGAFYLQEVTLIGLVGVALWLAIAAVPAWLGTLSPSMRRVVLGGGLVLALLMAWFVLSQFGAELLGRYRSTTLWKAPERNHFWFYHFWFNLYYPTLWSIFPIVALLALNYRRNPALFCLCIFVPALLLHSFAGMKDLRYIFYALPFLFVLWGIALAAVLQGLRSFLRTISAGALSALGLPPTAPLRTAVVAASLGFIILANTASVRTPAVLAGVAVPPAVEPPDWAAAVETLRPWLDSAAVVLTTSELEALYFLGHYDIQISKSRLSELPEAVEFGRDGRTGRPVVSTPESVDLIIACFPDGLIVTSAHRWRVSGQLDNAIADLIVRRRLSPIELPRSSHILAFRWERSPGAVRPEACARLPPDEAPSTNSWTETVSGKG